MKQIVYIAHSESKNIEVWNLDQNGNMEIMQKIYIDGQVQPINIIKNKNLLYAGIRPKNRIIVYNIKKDGYLTQNNEIYIPGSPNYISFSSDKRFLFCSSYHYNTLTVIPLNKEGIPKNPIQVVHNINGCHAALLNTKYNILFVTALKEDHIYLYHLTKYGILKSTKQKFICTQSQSGPRHLKFHSNENFVYTINELNGTIDVWKIDMQKNIPIVENIQNIHIVKNHTISNKYWSSDIHLTLCSNFLYVSDRILNTISLFHINKNNGKILFIKSYFTEIQPRSFCIDANNKYLIVAGQISNKFTVYIIDQKTGDLKKLNTYSTEKDPLWILTCIN